MATYSSLDRDINREQGLASSLEETQEIHKKSNNILCLEKGKEKHQSSRTIPYYKLFCLADSFDYVLMFFGTIAAVGNGICMPLMALLFGELIDATGKTVSTTVLAQGVYKVSLKFVYLALGSSVASFIQMVCWTITGEAQATRIRTLYFKTILRQEISFFDKDTSTGEIVGRMSGDSILIQDAMGEKVGKFVQTIAAFFGGFVIAFMNGWLLTLIMLSLIPPIALLGAVMFKLIGKLASRKQIAYSHASTIIEQTIGSIRTVASFTREQQAISKYNIYLLNAYKSGIQEGLASGLTVGTVLLILSCGYASALWLGGKMILENGYTGGNVIIVIFGVLLGSMSIGQAAPCLSAVAAGQAAGFKIFVAINRKPEIDAYDANGLTLDEIRGDIELRNVNFNYPARPDEKILDGFSFSVPSGTTTALVGQSGSGKSTVISLIERFYDPQAGEVLIDGVNLRYFQLRWIRNKIGLVSQEPVLFTSSIGDNIAYGKIDATNEEIEAAAELANAANFIKKLPQGLDTMVGEHGIQLSGGQKQRVAIARAILKDPRILLLDEATSSLDVESERLVQEALDRIMINRTTLIVSHRLSTLRTADMIAVIHQGKIVEKGSRPELLKFPEGAYSQLIRLQGSGKKQEKKDLNHSERARRSSPFAPSSSPMISISEKPFENLIHTPASQKLQLSREVPLGRLARLNSPEIPILLVGSIFAIVNGAITPIFGIVFAAMIRTFYEPKDELKRDSQYWALIFLVLGVVSFLTSPMSTYLFAMAGCKLIMRIRSMCFEKVVYMEIGWFDEAEHSSGAIAARLSSDATSVRSLVGDTLSLIVQNTTTAVVGLVIAFKASWRLSFLILAVFPLLGVSSYIQLKSVQGFDGKSKERHQEASQVVSDAISNIRTVASFCAEDKVMQLYKKKCEGPIKVGIKPGLISGLGFGISSSFFFCVYAISFYVGGMLVDHGKATFSEFFNVFLALSMTAVGISQTSFLAPDVGKAKSSTSSILNLLDQISKINSSDKSGKKLRNVRGKVEFRHVSFKYPTRPDIEIFRNLCLIIQSGKMVAIVGESGSGKSTMISLLQRFYDPNSGKIMLDGIEIQKLQLKWLRQQMGLVSQEPVLFNDTIRANIAYGKEGDATETEIIAAAELANAHSFISGLKQGYNTLVGEKGIQLSGGQKQRVAITRAIVKAPKILLLDEATSALDLESERVVQDALDRVMVNQTTIVITHQLSTIKNSDLIAVMKDGIIVEKGKHEHLLNIKNGIYASFIASHTCK